MEFPVKTYLLSGCGRFGVSVWLIIKDSMTCSIEQLEASAMAWALRLDSNDSLSVKRWVDVEVVGLAFFILTIAPEVSFFSLMVQI
jgi:hypothetical protein